MFLPLILLCSPLSRLSCVPPTGKQEPIESELAVKQMFDGTAYRRNQLILKSYVKACSSNQTNLPEIM